MFLLYLPRSLALVFAAVVRRYPTKQIRKWFEIFGLSHGTRADCQMHWVFKGSKCMNFPGFSGVSDKLILYNQEENSEKI